MQTTFKILLLAVLALLTNRAVSVLGRGPALPILGWSILLHTGESILYSVVLAAGYSLFLRRGRLALVTAISGIILASAYPAYLVATALLYGMALDVPSVLYWYLLSVAGILCLGPAMLKKAARFPLRLAGIEPALMAVFFLMALPSIYFAGMAGHHNPVYVQYYATFVHLVLCLLLVSIFYTNATRIIPLLASLWSVFFSGLVLYEGDVATAYGLAVFMHLAWAAAYWYRVGKGEQGA